MSNSNQHNLRVQLNGILLSTLLFQCANARSDFEGLILGTVVKKTRSTIDDHSDERIATLYTTAVIQGIHKLEPHLPRIYDMSGKINPAALSSLQIPSNLSILGYVKFRRTSNHVLSLRDTAVALSLKKHLRKQQTRKANREPEKHDPVLIALITAKALDPRSIHDYDYTWWSIEDIADAPFRALPVDISNMIQSPQEDYQSMLSNLAQTSSNHSSSIAFSNTLRSVSMIQPVAACEDMCTKSVQDMKKQVAAVLASELEKQKETREVEELERQIRALE